jgi:hypothetical protein
MNETIEYIKKVKGEILVDFKEDDSGPLKYYSFKFRPLNGDDGHKVVIKANNISFVKQDKDLVNVFKVIGFEKIIGKKLLEYEDWHAEVLTDTGNITAPQYNITLIFEEGYAVEVENYQ